MDLEEKPSKLRLDPPYFDQRKATHLTLILVTFRVKLSRLTPLQTLDMTRGLNKLARATGLSEDVEELIEKKAKSNIKGR
jgi:hypothetical protein